MRYFMLIPAERFERLGGVLRACRLERSFRPAVELCRSLGESAQPFVQREPDGLIEPLTLAVAGGMPFTPERWRLLLGELLLLSAAELPQIETPLEAFAPLIGVELAEKRADFAPIQQAIAGSRDLCLGACYRPEHAGWNDLADVRRLAGWLASIDHSGWDAMKLTLVQPDQRADELAFAREWFPALVEMYRRAAEAGWVVVCEEI
jgi:hypothetical protein